MNKPTFERFIDMNMIKISYYLLVCSIIIGGCSPNNATNTAITDQAGGNPTTNPIDSISTASIPTNTSEPTITPTKHPTATFTPEAILTEIPTYTETATEPSCTNRATLVQHLSFPDGSRVQTGYFFNKAWRIENSGTCTWNTAYNFVFSTGAQMEASPETPLTQNVAPGETVDINILMRAPDIANSYSGYWMLRDPNGTLFGTGDNADQPISINVMVRKPTRKEDYFNPGCG
jgi:hypothetical protein